MPRNLSLGLHMLAVFFNSSLTFLRGSCSQNLELIGLTGLVGELHGSLSPLSSECLLIRPLSSPTMSIFTLLMAIIFVPDT